MMRRGYLKLLAAVLAAVLVLGLGACTGSVSSGDTVTVWFLAPLAEDLSSDYLVSVDVPVSRNADKVTEAVRALMSGAGGYESPYPSEVAVKNIDYSGGRVVIDFNREYLEMSGADMAYAEACAAMTLCGIEGITGVSFTVDGVRCMTGSQSSLSADNVVTGDLSLKPVEREVSIYFSDGSTQYVVSETRNVVLRENALVARYIVDELIKGPSDEALMSTMPEGVSLLSITTEGRVCHVNFSSEFEKIMQSGLAERIQTLTAITNSLCGEDIVDCVQFYVEGERLFDSPMYANVTAIGKYADDVIECSVYLPSDDRTGAESVTMRISTAGGFDLNRLLCERLATGIDGNGFMSALPRGTRVNGVSVESGVAVIDFSREFAQNEPPEGVSRELMERTIALTLSATNEGVGAVTFLVEGEAYDGGRIVTGAGSVPQGR